MAFYTSRVDNNGNEIERHHSARSLASSRSSSVSGLNISSRSCDSRSIKYYINSAAYIEKNVSLTENDTCSSLSENQIDIVPPLDLQSEDNYSTTRRDYTFSYEPVKIKHNPDNAYKTWLSAKRKHLSDEAARRKKAEEQKRMEAEERKRLAEENYKKWLENKTRQQKQQSSQLSLSQQSSSSTSSFEATEKHPIRSQISDEEAEARLEKWERAKRLEEEHRRILKRQEEKRRQELEEQRRKMSAEAWEKWSIDAARKPKPVPLNRGIFTLNGSVSNIFVNPNEWQPILPVTSEENH